LVKIRLEEDSLAPQENFIVANLRKFDEEYTKRYNKEFDEYKRLWESKVESRLMARQNPHVLLKEVTEKLGETKEMLKAAMSDRERILAATESGNGRIERLVWQFRMEEKMPREVHPQNSNARMLEKLRLRIGGAEDDYRLRKTRFPIPDAEALDSYKKLVDTKIDSLEKEFRALQTQQKVHATNVKELQKLEKLDQEIAIQGDKVNALNQMLKEISKRYGEITSPLGHERNNTY